MSKRVALTGLRVIVSVVLLAVLYVQVRDLEIADLLPDWSLATAAWLAGAVALTGLSIVLAAFRWHQVLHALRLHCDIRGLVSTTFAGQFLSNVLPTTIGGDALRVSWIRQENSDTAGSMASVILERLTGWVVLPAITFLALAIRPSLLDLGRATALTMTVAVVTLTSLGALVLVAGNRRLGDRVAGGDGWRSLVEALHIGVDRLRSHPSALLQVMGVGFAYQMVLVLAAVMAARALDIDEIGVVEMMAFFPAVAVLQVLPIAIGGIGVRENLFVVFLGALGAADPVQAKAIPLGLLLYLMTVVASLPGAPAFVAGNRAANADS